MQSPYPHDPTKPMQPVPSYAAVPSGYGQMAPTTDYEMIPGYGPLYPVVYAARPPYRMKAVGSFVFGIIGFLLLPAFGLGFLFGIFAVAEGHSAMKEFSRDIMPRSGRALAFTGILLGWISIAIGAIAILVAIAFAGAIASAISSFA